MFGTIRRHQNWLWAVIITVIIISFVIFFAPDVKIGGRARPSAELLGSINGEALGLDEFNAASTEARLNAFLRSGGTWPERNASSMENLKRDAIFRAFLIRKLKEMHIQASPEAVARLARERLGENVVNNLRQFEKEYLAQGGVSLPELESYLEHEAGIQQLLQAATAGAKLIEPREAASLYRQENEKLATQVALFSASNLLAKASVTPEAVTNYYNRQQALYRLPERIQIAYIPYYASNSLAEAEKTMAQRTNLNAQIDEIYLRQGPDSFKGTNDAKLTEAEAKAKIKELIQRDFALYEARRKANDFGTELYNQEVTNAPAFEKLAAAKGLVVKTSPPFDRNKGLEDTEFPAAFRQKAIDVLDKQAVVYAPILTSNAVYLIALKSKIPSELPTLAQLRDKVTADARHAQALELARAEGNAFHTTLTNALAQKKPFAEVADQAKVRVITVPPFSLSAAVTNLDEGINPRILQNVAESLKPGEASQFIPLMEGGMIVYLRERIPVSDEQVKKELPEFVGRLRFYRQNEAFNNWFRKQAELAKLVVPQNESMSAPGGGGSGKAQPGSAPKPAPAAAPRPAAPKPTASATPTPAPAAAPKPAAQK